MRRAGLMADFVPGGGDDALSLNDHIGARCGSWSRLCGRPRDSRRLKERLRDPNYDIRPPLLAQRQSGVAHAVPRRKRVDRRAGVEFDAVRIGGGG